jgi:hypothetical protein
MTTVVAAIANLVQKQTAINTTAQASLNAVNKTNIRPAFTLQAKQTAADQNFFETEVAAGGADTVKNREGTLQEFVLAYFFFSLLLFAVAITVGQYAMTGGNVGASFRTLLLYIVVVFVLLAMILRYA